MKNLTIRQLLFVLMAVGVVVAVVYSVISYHYLKEATVKANQMESINRAYYVTKEMSGLYDTIAKEFAQREDECYDALKEAQLYFKKNGRNASVEVLKKQLKRGRKGSIYDVALINDQFIIEATTYPRELGLDFKTLRDAYKVLQEVFNDPEYIDLSVVMHAATYVNMKRFIVQRATGEPYMIQLGLTLDKAYLEQHSILKLQEHVPNLINSRVYQLSRSPRAPLGVERFFTMERYRADETKKISALHMSEEFDTLMSSMDEQSKVFKDREDRYRHYVERFNTEKFLNTYFWQDDTYVHRVVMPLFSRFNSYNDSLTLLIMEFDESASQHTIQTMNIMVTVLWTLLTLMALTAVWLVRSRIVLPLSFIEMQMKHKEKVLLSTNPHQTDEVGAITRTYNQLLDDLHTEIKSNRELLEQFKVFAGNAIHQIRTPLSVIKIAMEMLYTTNKEAKEQIQASLVSIEHMYDSLSYMVQAEEVEYPAERLDLSALFKKRIAFFQVVAHANDIDFDLYVEPGLFVMMNPTEAEYLIDNNLSNAIKFGIPGKIVTLSLRCLEGELKLSFTNYGVPIQNVETIFQRHVREDESRHGSGIGLNMVETICEHNHILIEVDHLNGQNHFAYYIEVM